MSAMLVICSVMPAGRRSLQARSAAMLSDALRRLPQIPRTFRSAMLRISLVVCVAYPKGIHWSGSTRGCRQTPRFTDAASLTSGVQALLLHRLRAGIGAHMNKTVVAMTGLLASGAALGQTINFDTDAPGTLPAAWEQGVTGRGNPRWAVRQDASAPSAPHVLQQSGSGTFPWCVLR